MKLIMPDGTVVVTDVTRFELITDKGREYTSWNVAGLSLSVQDDGRTLKVFIQEKTNRCDSSAGHET